MGKIYTALGLMSGTSGDGIDASVVQSDGEKEHKVLTNHYTKYEPRIRDSILEITDKITNPSELFDLEDRIDLLTYQITKCHVVVAKEMIKQFNIDLIGFHGQTIYHSPENLISKQIGWGDKLSHFTKKIVVYDFRKNDLNNGGQGAPLTPIFHKLIVEKNKIELPVIILNIGGIANITLINDNNKMSSLDIGPGNCLIDRWMRLNSDKNFDKDGLIAKSGKIDKIILKQSLDFFYNHPISKLKSFNINDFWLFNFVNNLSIENGAATLTEFTADILSKKIKNKNIYACGGGRKNKFLMEKLQKKTGKEIKLIDDLNIDGDFIESQAFGYLAIRSYLKLPISFPETTGCKKPSTGGVIIKNF